MASSYRQYLQYIAQFQIVDDVKEEQKNAVKEKIQTAINSLHSEGLVHGDLRAINILVAGMMVAVTIQVYLCTELQVRESL